MNSTLMQRLPPHLQARLNLIIHTIPLFWEKSPHKHFTNHGPAHAERVQRKLEELAHELPTNAALTEDEIFIGSAATQLYDVGMQSRNLMPILDFEYNPGEPLSPSQLEQVRANKHLLSQSLILDSVRRDYQGPPLHLGVTQPADEYTWLIAEVCRWCSDEPLENVPDTLPINNKPVRVRLLAALLRLANQLYIHRSRVDLAVLQTAALSLRQQAKWYAYHYAQILPIANGQIRVHYYVSPKQKEFLGYIRGLLEPDFEYSNNPVLRYLWNFWSVRLLFDGKPIVTELQPGFESDIELEKLIAYLKRHIVPVRPPGDKVSPVVPPIEDPIMIKILFLAANPLDTTRVRVDEEARAIDYALLRARFRDRFDLRQHMAVRARDLQNYLLRHTPDIVHFSGHGTELHEIILEDESGNSQPVPPHALSRLFSILGDNIRCIMLNACFSEPQAQAIAQHIDCVIGMPDLIGDVAAIRFAAAFYEAIGFGRNVKTAFDLGCVQLDLLGLKLAEKDQPRLLAVHADPTTIVFADGK